ncbi:hypothetical protein MKX75_16785 [Paenibacillus sp. FSL R5-0341]|uniref:hypothetical protein n=1 Tax=Paenibacillus sp. FSL R5-0341 TaxID=2921636 RepID=UPI0030D61FA2
MVNKEELLKRVIDFSKSAHEYEDIGVLLIKKCKKLYLKINSIDDTKKQNKLIKMKFELDEIELSLKHHKLKISNAHGKLVSPVTYNFIYYSFLFIVMIYSFLYISIDSIYFLGGVEINAMEQNIILYAKYLTLSVMGVLFYYITNYLVKFSEILTRLLVACFIPILLIGVIFKLENGNLAFSGSQSIIFLLGYNTNLVISILKIGNDKIKASIEGKKTESI